MSTALVKEQNMEKQVEKQMGCMAGFLQIFDRHQILSGKRHSSAGRLPLPPVADTASESEKSAPPSPVIPENPKRSPAVALANLPPKSPLRFPVLESKEGTRSPWKFGRETPRLSLDSRATTDAKGGLHPKQIRTGASILSTANRCDSIASDATDESRQHSSPSHSVIARLMGLEPLPDSSVTEAETRPQLRRSASESRVTRDLFQSRLMADKPKPPPSPIFTPIDAHYEEDPMNYKAAPPNGLSRGSFKSPSPWKAHHNRKAFFDSGDFFPESRPTVSMQGEIGNRLKIRGNDEPSKDLHTLKQILEALQLRGLLHSRKTSEQNQVSHQNLVYEESPIVVMKPPRLPNSTPINRRRGNDCSPSNGKNQIRGAQRNYSLSGENSQSASPRREGNSRSPNRYGRNPSPIDASKNDINAIGRRSNSLVKPKPLRVETQTRKNESTENRRVSPVHSPKLNLRRTDPDPTAINQSPRSKKSTVRIHQKNATTTVAAEDESSSISESSITTSTGTERSKTEEYREGRHLLERCGKLIHSIAEITATDMQPSPVSVLDSSFYKDESSTPSPITTRRNINFKDQYGSETEDCEMWAPTVLPFGSKPDDPDFVYVSDVLRASHYLSEEPDVFLLLEKQQCLKGKDTSKVSVLKRKLIFDTIREILDRNTRLPPWKVVSSANYGVTKPSAGGVWSEFKRTKERENAEDMFGTICGVLKKDLAGDGINGWGDCPVEMSEVILDMERLIFKDLICESIGDFAALASRSTYSRRKLIF
ncbi:hypothetical protein OROGR_024990 [Orobanche gracilis]